MVTLLTLGFDFLGYLLKPLFSNHLTSSVTLLSNKILSFVAGENNQVEKKPAEVNIKSSLPDPPNVPLAAEPQVFEIHFHNPIFSLYQVSYW